VRALAWLAVGVGICLVVFLATGGHVFLLPLILILPVGLFGLRRR